MDVGTEGLTPTDDLLAELARKSAEFEAATPQQILAWTAERFAPRFTMATAFGPEGMVLIHMLAEVAPKTPIFNLDTGYQFQETLELRERVRQRYGIEVEMKQPETSVAEYEAANGGPVYKTDPNRCCADRKLSVLRKAIEGMHAWASAIRREQTPDRAASPIVGWDKKFGLVKVSPLANWTKSQVWKMITDLDIPYNPLHDKGYPSIGCFPCTRAVLFGEDERAGRWSGFAKTECGLHSSENK
jgi:phosphoadenosine phosphosulfate reductase